MPKQPLTEREDLAQCLRYLTQFHYADGDSGWHWDHTLQDARDHVANHISAPDEELEFVYIFTVIDQYDRFPKE